MSIQAMLQFSRNARAWWKLCICRYHFYILMFISFGRYQIKINRSWRTFGHLLWGDHTQSIKYVCSFGCTLHMAANDKQFYELTWPLACTQRIFSSFLMAIEHCSCKHHEAFVTRTVFVLETTKPIKQKKECRFWFVGQSDVSKRRSFFGYTYIFLLHNDKYQLLGYFLLCEL